MPNVCLCNDLSIESCPPYASLNDFKKIVVAMEECAVCSGIVDRNTTLANLKTTAGIDDCCEEVIIQRESQVLYSLDGGTSWLETGVRRLSHTINFGSIAFVDNVAQTPNITTSTAHVNEVPVTYSSNRLNITEDGTYMFTVTYQLTPTVARSLTNFVFEVLVNGSAANPRMQSSNTILTNAVTDPFYSSFTSTIILAANSGISFRFLSGQSFTSDPTQVFVNMWKVGN